MKQSKICENYNVEAQAIRKRVSEYIDNEHDPLGINRSTFLSSRYELIRTNIFHFLSVIDVEKNRKTAREILSDATIISDLDHNVAYGRHLLDRLKVIDVEQVLQRAARGESFLFALTHTGPFFLPLFALPAAEIHIALSVPPHPQAGDLVDVCKKQLTSREREYVTFVEMNKANYVSRLRELIRTRHASIVTYMDGFVGAYTKSLLKNKNMQSDCKFLQARITPLTATLRLARFLGLDLVPVSAKRESGPQCTVRIGRPLPVAEAAPLDVVRGLYGFLESVVMENPTQWEGWVYFHNFLSESYKNKIKSNIGITAESGSNQNAKDRYFLTATSDGAQIMDRVTLQLHNPSFLKEAS